MSEVPTDVYLYSHEKQPGCSAAPIFTTLTATQQIILGASCI